jgi:hypothetical protein
MEFPIPKDGTADTELLVEFFEDIETRLRPPPQIPEFTTEELSTLFLGEPDYVEERVIILPRWKFEWLLQWTLDNPEAFEKVLRQNDVEKKSTKTREIYIFNEFLEVDKLGRRLYDVMERTEQLRRDRGINTMPKFNDENVYIFSKDGHGRSGLVGGAILGRLYVPIECFYLGCCVLTVFCSFRRYGVTPAEALERVQTYHDVRNSMQARTSKLKISSPGMINQSQQVRDVLAKTEPIYGGGGTEIKDDDDFHQFHAIKRGTGVTLVRACPADAASLSSEPHFSSIVHRHAPPSTHRIRCKRKRTSTTRISGWCASTTA